MTLLLKPSLTLGTSLNASVKCSMTFSTTKTRDPDLIDKARDLLWLFSLAVPASQARKVLNRSHWDVIKLGYQRDGLCSKFGIQREQFLERRKLLSHPSLKEIGDMLMCDFCLDGDIFVALGPIKSVKLAREVVEGSIVSNIHPVSRLYITKTTEMQIQARKLLEDLRL